MKKRVEYVTNREELQEQINIYIGYGFKERRKSKKDNTSAIMLKKYKKKLDAFDVTLWIVLGFVPLTLYWIYLYRRESKEVSIYVKEIEGGATPLLEGENHPQSEL